MTAERTTTTTTPTTTYPLPPILRLDVRYPVNADHYWNALDMPTTQRLQRDVIYDRGFNNSISIRSLKSFGKTAYFSPINVQPSYINNVALVSDHATTAAFYFDKNRTSCIKLTDLRLLPNNIHQNCLRDPGICYYGFAVGVWVKFPEEALESGSKTILMASGKEAGFMLAQAGIYTMVEVRSGLTIWKSTAYDVDLVPNKWINIGFSWNRIYGAKASIRFSKFFQ